MSPVPILDDAYMERRRRMLYFESYAQSMRASWGFSARQEREPDPIDEARELYATGKIDLPTFAARIDVALKGKAQ